MDQSWLIYHEPRNKYVGPVHLAVKIISEQTWQIAAPPPLPFLMKSVAGRWRIFNIVDPKESYNGKHESEQRIMLAEWTDAEISKIIYNESINNYCCRWKWIRFCRKGECNTSVWVHRKVNPWAFEIWMFESSLLVAIAAPRGLNSWTVRWASECFFAMYSCYHW